MTHPNCEHQCSGRCRREGCNCLCGEFHDTLDQDEVNEIIKEQKAEKDGEDAFELARGN